MVVKKILIVSDAWEPQINGVVRTLQETIFQLRKLGHTVCMMGPDETLWNTVALPLYPSIKLELFGGNRLEKAAIKFSPDFIHIATEGPLGWAARSLCLRHKWPFTTSYHTRFPDYCAARVPPCLAKLVTFLAIGFLRRFHAPSSVVMVATATLEKELRHNKYRHIARWSRGVNTQLFYPYGKELKSYELWPRPRLLYVGRVAVEKNLRAFLNVQTDGCHIVIGDGPDSELLKKEYPHAHFLGSMEGEQLARHYAAADLFVFPSTTDTFGLVLLEACASGLRIASTSSPGPLDIFSADTSQAFAVLDNDLERAVSQALLKADNPMTPHQYAQTYSWQACTQQFFNHLQAPTPLAVKRLGRLRNWLNRWR